MPSTHMPPIPPEDPGPEGRADYSYRESIETVRQGVDEIKEALLGTLDNGKPGLIARVGQLEKETILIKRILIAFGTTIGGGSLAWLKTFLGAP